MGCGARLVQQVGGPMAIASANILIASSPATGAELGRIETTSSESVSSRWIAREGARGLGQHSLVRRPADPQEMGPQSRPNGRRLGGCHLPGDWQASG